MGGLWCLQRSTPQKGPSSILLPERLLASIYRYLSVLGRASIRRLACGLLPWLLCANPYIRSVPPVPPPSVRRTVGVAYTPARLKSRKDYSPFVGDRKVACTETLSKDGKLVKTGQIRIMVHGGGCRDPTRSFPVSVPSRLFSLHSAATKCTRLATFPTSLRRTDRVRGRATAGQDLSCRSTLLRPCSGSLSIRLASGWKTPISIGC